MSSRPVAVRLTLDIDSFTGRLQLITAAIIDLNARLRWRAVIDANRRAAREFLDHLVDEAWADLGMVRPAPLLWDGDQA